MDKLEVFGARKLKGNVRISGSKNAALPILAASILSNKKITLKNLPNVKDIKTMIKLLESIGSNIKFSNKKNSITIQNKNKIKTFAFPYLANIGPSTRIPALIVFTKL